MARTRQPRGIVLPVGDWNWVVNFNSGASSPELLSSSFGTAGGAPSAAAYEDVVGLKLVSVSSQYWQGPVAGIPTTFPITFVASFVVSSLSVAARIFTSGMASNYAGLYFWVSPTGTIELGYGNNTSNSTGTGNCFLSTTAGSVVVGKRYSLVAVVKSGSIECWLNGSKLSGTLNGTSTTIVTTGSPLVGRLNYSGDSYYTDATVGLVALSNRDKSNQLNSLSSNPWQLFAPQRRLWIQLGAASGGTGTDAAIAGTQDSDVGAITAEATTAAALAGTQDSDVGAITVEATTGSAIAGTQDSDVGAITAEATTGAAIAGTQDSDGAALEVTAGTGSTDAAMAGTQASDVGAITAEATLGLTLSATQASDVGYIVVEATLPASMAGTQDSDVAAITVTAAGTSIWTDISGSTTSWSDQAAASTIWTDI